VWRPTRTGVNDCSIVFLDRVLGAREEKLGSAA
jgi:hypothetical protein